MPRIMSVEKSKFINENIKIYKKNKLGQYSKFLDKNPIFVTYYHINQTMTRTDIGTGGIEHEVGVRSPIRFNKLLEFPVYGIPDLKPTINFDESGYDIDLELSDILILPNTIKPSPGDYMLVSIADVPKILFRINNIAYNTVQSNDFYMIDMDAKYIGDDVDRIDGEINDRQVVDIYQTVFDNIGTQDKCFVLEKEIQNINTLVHTFYDLREKYYNDYYDAMSNSFILYADEYDENGMPVTIYDPYLEAFINKSRIFYDENKNTSLVLTPNDVLDRKFNSIFDRSLYHALLSKSNIQLSPYEYFYCTPIQKRSSVFRMYNMNTNSINLVISKFNLLENQNTDTSDPLWDKLKPDGWVNTWVATKENMYFDIPFLEAIKSRTDLDTNNYYEIIILSFMNNTPIEIEREKIYEIYDELNRETFIYIPIVLYILTQIYNKYFHNSKAIDL